MESFLYPLSNIQQAFGLMLLKFSVNDINFVCESFNEIFKSHFDPQTLDLTIEKFIGYFKLDLLYCKNLLSMLQNKVNTKKKLLLPPIYKCHRCSFKLDYSDSSYKNIIYYSFDGPENRVVSIKKCKVCSISYSFSGYYENNKYFVYDQKVILLNVFSFKWLLLILIISGSFRFNIHQ